MNTKIVAGVLGGICVLALIWFGTTFVTTAKVKKALGEKLAAAGVEEGDWSVKSAYYVPIVSTYVVRSLEIKSKDDSTFAVDKLNISGASFKEGFNKGTLEVKGFRLSSDDGILAVKSFEAKDFAVNTSLLKDEPAKAISALKSFSLKSLSFEMDGKKMVEVPEAKATVNYVRGKISHKTNASIKNMTITNLPSPKARPEYRFSLASDASYKNGVYSETLSIDGKNLFNLKLSTELSELPVEVGEDFFSMFNSVAAIKIGSVSVDYKDASLVNHLFEIAEVDKQEAINSLKEDSAWIEERIENGEEFVDLVIGFLENPTSFKLTTTASGPVKVGDLAADPNQLGLTFSVSGGAPFAVNFINLGLGGGGDWNEDDGDWDYEFDEEEDW